jgi:hypothetical protein
VKFISKSDKNEYFKKIPSKEGIFYCVGENWIYGRVLIGDTFIDKKNI